MILEEVDFVLAGAEAVVENGGIINRVSYEFFFLINQLYYKSINFILKIQK